MAIFFTADEHYGHTKIMQYCKRPFDSIEEMDETIIERHNAVVRPKDTVYHLGDFSFWNHGKYLDRLKGKHILILGNHDRLKNTKEGWLEVHQVMRLKWQGKVLWLSHYPHLVWPQSHYGSWHLFGHVHGSLQGVGLSMDVGVDANDYRPVSIEKVAEVMNQRGANAQQLKDAVDKESLKPYAKKYIWWKTPEEAVEYPQRVIAQVMNIGTFEDTQELADLVGNDVLRMVIEQAEVGQFNGPSWAYWHYRLELCEIDQVPPLPERRGLR
jgi:calcineurin-like phosphoesterase family protein